MNIARRDAFPKIERAVGEFRALERRLRAEAPSAIEAADALAADLVCPATAGPDALWEVVWNKPLYANTRVAIANSWCNQLAPFMVEGWKDWGSRYGRIYPISPSNAAGRARAAWSYGGSDADAIRAATRTPAHRICAIAHAASGLREFIRENAVAPLEPLSRLPVGLAVERLRERFGWGWGPVTCLHLLTDLGLACKPDLNLAATVVRLGLAPSTMDAKTVDGAVFFDGAVKTLLVAVDGAVTPKRLRWIDKMLMEMNIHCKP